jgi:hypothetical protein
LGAYLASLTEASKMIVDRFSSVSSASVQGRIEFLREDWSKAFGALPEVASQKALSAASDERLFPLLQASPQCPRCLGRKPSVGYVGVFLALLALAQGRHLC